MAKNYIIYTHQSPELQTLEELINSTDSLLINFSVDQILNFKDDNGTTNAQRIYDSYTLEQQKEYELEYDLNLLSIINIGTTLALPKDKLNRETLITEGNQVIESLSAAAFVAKQLADLNRDPNYTQVHISSDRSLGITKEMYPEITVWLWCRSMSPSFDQLNTSNGELPGTIIDLSPFIVSLQTSTAGVAGDWQIQLPPITCEQDEQQAWKIKKANLSGHETSNKSNYTYEDNLNHRLNSEDGIGKRNQFFFHNIVQENDVIFIRFETLKNETLRRKFSSNFEISKDQLAGNIYDMIGLVDQNTITVNPDSNDVSININGRDLMKVLIEDGSYFYPEALINEISNTNQSNKILKRTVVNGGFETLFKYTYRPIDLSVKFVINQLANIGITPDDLFSSYAGGVVLTEDNQTQDRRSKFFTLQDDNLNTVAETTMKGIWQIIKMVFDSSIANRRIVDQSISFANGSLINYVNKICQDPWVQFYGDTYSDQYVFITRQAPFTREGFMSLIPALPGDENIAPVGNIRDEDVLSENLTFESGDVYSWYRLNTKSNQSGVDAASLAVAPTVFFDRYADIWGSRPLDMESNYVPYIPRRGDKANIGMNYYLQQAIHDLKFMVDSNAYLPFTRKGTITINGDRRFKKGMVIRYIPTGEVFYVDGISQSYNIGSNIDRTTTLTVSRGMVEKYLYGGKKKTESNNDSVTQSTSTIDIGTIPTYWDIIDTNIEKLYEQKIVEANADPYQINLKIINNWKINNEIFNFFLTRRQFD